MKARIFVAVALGLLVSPVPSLARAGEGGGPRLAISQGIAAPNVTSPVNISHGFVPTNPAVAGTLNSVYGSLEYGRSDENNQKSSTAGVELGVGNSNVGIAVGYLKPDCNGCDGDGKVILGGAMDSFAIGLAYDDDKDYSVGFLINPNGEHRFGLVGSLHDADQAGQDIKSYGVGYSYNAGSVVFAVDASKRQSETATPTDDVIIVTPGLQVKADWLALMVSYDFHTNNEAQTFKDSAFIGVGFDGGDMHLAIYHDYFHDWSVVGTFWF